MAKKKAAKKKRIDPHLACYSYPNCDEGGSGCVVVDGDNAEPYGYRDEPEWLKEAERQGVMIVRVEKLNPNG